MLPRPEAPARRLPYTTADMAERLAKRKAEQDAAAQAKANQALRFGVTNPPVREDKGGGTGLWPSWGELGNAAKMGLGTFVGAVNSVPATALDTADEIVQGLEKVMGVDSEDHFDPAFVGSYNLFGETYRGFDNAAQYVGKQIAATPGVGKPSSSPFMDTVRSQGWANAIAEPFVHAVNVGSVAYPVSKVAVGAKLPGTITNAYRQRLLEREIAAQNNLFPAVVPPKPGTFIELVEDADGVLRVPGATKPPANVVDVDALQGSRLPARVVDSPVTPAPVTPALTAAELARLQREAARAAMGVSIKDIEFPPAPSADTLAALAADKLSAQDYMVKRIKEIDPELAKLPVDELIKNPEAKAFFDQWFMHSRTLDSSLDGYEQIHPQAWKELGVAQEQSGFNAQQMPDQMASVRRYFSNEFPAIQSYLTERITNPKFENLGSTHAQLITSILTKGLDATVADMENLIKNIDQAFEVVPPLTQPIVVYRGVGLTSSRDPYIPAFYRNLKPGDLIYDPALSSTSIDKNLAQKWAAQPDDAILIIRLPAGSKTINPISSWRSGVSEMNLHSHAPNEKELLLPRNSVFKVIKSDGKFIEVELVLDEKITNATNTRTGSKQLAETMSFNDAMSLLSGEQIKQSILKNRILKIKPSPNVESSAIVQIGSGLFNNKLVGKNSPESVLQSVTNRAIFNDVINAVKNSPLDPQTNRKLLDIIFSNLNVGGMRKDFFELNAKGTDLAAGASRNIVREIEKQQAWMNNNPGKTPKPVFVNENGGVVNNPFIDYKTWHNKYFVIAKGQIYDVGSATYDKFLNAVAQYKSINPNITIADGAKLFKSLDQVGVLGQNKLDDLNELFKEFVEGRYKVLDSDAYWAQEEKFWADLAEENK